MDSEFEQRLRRQPLKQVPGEWRAEILSAVAADVNRRQNVSGDVSREFTFTATAIGRPSLLSTLNSQLSTLLWPHPKAWAGLAAVWVLILALNVSTQEKPVTLAVKTPQATPEVLVELRQQHMLYAELIGTTESREADRRPLFLPKPRSERVEISAA